MLPEKRRELIMEMLYESKSIKNSEISARFGVNSLTVRRDLDILKQQGLVKRVYGGAFLADDATTATTKDKTDALSPTPAFFQTREIALATEAVKLVHEGDILFLGNGITTAEIAKQLRHFSHLTIVTSSLLVVNQMLNTSNDVYVLGGKLHQDEQNFYGSHAIEMLKAFRAHKAFINGDFSTKNGVMSNFIPAAELGTLMVQNADMAVLVCSSSQLDDTALYSVCPLSDIDVIITDERLTSEQKQSLEKIVPDVRIAVSSNSQQETPEILPL